jgi:hypothetical protein
MERGAIGAVARNLGARGDVAGHCKGCFADSACSGADTCSVPGGLFCGFSRSAHRYGGLFCGFCRAGADTSRSASTLAAEGCFAESGTPGRDARGLFCRFCGCSWCGHSGGGLFRKFRARRQARGLFAIPAGASGGAPADGLVRSEGCFADFTCRQWPSLRASHASPADGATGADAAARLTFVAAVMCMALPAKLHNLQPLSHASAGKGRVVAKM